MLHFLITAVVALIANVQQLAPALDEETAASHVEAAQRAATAYDLDVELLLAMAYIESRYDPTAISRIEDGKRRGSAWPHDHAAGSGPRFCGVMQTGVRHDWKACLALRDLDAGYLAGAKLLREWLKMARGDLTNALNGYGCGMLGLKNGCRHYAERVLAYQRRLQRAAS